MARLAWYGLVGSASPDVLQKSIKIKISTYILYVKYIRLTRPCLPLPCVCVCDNIWCGLQWQGDLPGHGLGGPQEDQFVAHFLIDHGVRCVG
jgi:hypothetical protein